MVAGHGGILYGSVVWREGWVCWYLPPIPAPPPLTTDKQQVYTHHQVIRMGRLGLCSSVLVTTLVGLLDLCRADLGRVGNLRVEKLASGAGQLAE